jgi:hypothetical protein
MWFNIDTGFKLGILWEKGFRIFEVSLSLIRVLDNLGCFRRELKGVLRNGIEIL